MRHVTYYHAETGMLHACSHLVSDDAAVALNAPAGHLPIDHPPSGMLHPLCHRVDVAAIQAEDDAAATEWAAKKETNRLARVAGGDPGTDPPVPVRVTASARHVVDYQPPAPTADHEWNATTKRWQLNQATSQRLAMANSARVQIARLERDVLPRVLREHALGYEGSQKRLADLDARIVDLRKSLS